MKRLATTVLGLWLAACGGDAADGQGDASACFEVQFSIPVQINRDVDILFVMDGSVSMVDRLAALETNVNRFADVLENIEGGLPGLHIGVVSSDVQRHGGALVTPRPECGIDGAFLRDLGYLGGERDLNYTGDFADAFTCLLGSTPVGGYLEEPLEAARRALQADAGFVREYAFLFVVFVTDEDDCSGGAALAVDDDEARSAYQCFADGVVCAEDTATVGTKSGCAARESPATLTPLAGYVDFLRGLKPDPSMVVVSALAADADPVVAQSTAGLALEPSCAAQTMEYPAIRLQSFLAAFPQRSTAVDVCNDDWSEALLLLAELQRKTLGAPCIDGRVDLDRDTPGPQVECVVSEVRGGEERILPACSSDDPPIDERPCWIIRDDPQCEDWFGFEVARWRETVLPGTHVNARCFGGCYPY